MLAAYRRMGRSSAIGDLAGGGEGEGLGHMGWGVVWGIGGGVLEECHVHMHIYTNVGTRITVGKKNKFLSCNSYSTIFNDSNVKIDHKSRRLAVDQIGPGLIYPFFSSDCGDPIIARTVPYC